MKKINKFLGLGLGVVAAFSLASCSNDVNEPNNTPDNEDVVLNLVKTPDVIAWTGSQTLLNTKGTRGYYTETENGEDKDYYYHNEEVEINLSVLNPQKKTVEDENGDPKEENKYDVVDLAAKLSIHVRQATDVTVTLPLDTKYIIDSDDLAIFADRLDEEELLANLTTTSHKVTCEVDGNEVELNVSFGSTENSKNKGAVTVTTTGVTDAVGSCLETYRDGLNFEVYIYLAEEKGREDTELATFKTQLNNSTVTFTENPFYYINAFAYNEDKTDVNGNDCTVLPVDEEGETLVIDAQSEEEIEEGYVLVGTMNHLNNAPYNKVYILSTKVADHAHGGKLASTGDVPTEPAPEE